jgi:hypothetical protein
MRIFGPGRAARRHERGRAAAGRPGRTWRVAAGSGALVLSVALGGPAVAAATAQAATVPTTGHATTGQVRRAVSPAAVGATLTLTSATALPDQPVGFTGAGFGAGEQVILHWRTAGGTTLAGATASQSGTISGSFHVPLPKAGVSAQVAVVAVGAASERQGKAAVTQACGDEWTGLSGGNWSRAADWSTGAVPGPSTAACITLPGPKKYTVVLNQLTGSTTVGSLRIGATSGKKTETLAIDPSKHNITLGLKHTSTINSLGVLLLTSAGGGNDYIAGPGTLDNDGLLSTITGKGWSRYLNTSIVNEPGGTFSVAAGTIPVGGTYQQDGSTLLNEGKLDVAKGSEYIVTVAALSQPGGRIANSGLMLFVHATIVKTGGTSTGNAWQFIHDSVFKDKAGTGSYTFLDSGTLSGVIPAGQTVTVDGTRGSDVKLGLSGNVTNDGALMMTSSSAQGKPTNAWLVPATGTAAPKLFNYGELLTEAGVGRNRYLNVNVINEPAATMDLDSAVNQLVGGWTITNDGTLDLGAGATLNLVGTSHGDANLIEGSTASTGVVIGGTAGTTSVIDQYACSTTGCQTDAVDLAGTLTVTEVGTPAGASVPIYSQQSVIAGAFAAWPAGYTVTYNGPDAAVPDAVGDVIITP